ncbi:MAG: hypothetical protein AAFX87_04600 [Bacteroidota bacterium]
MEDKEWERFNLNMPDGGPIYTEHNAEHLIVEPWNAISSLIIALPAIYWAIRLWGRYKEFPFLVYCLPLLFLNGIGSTLFHAFRVSKFFLMMDMLPPIILTISVSIYFWLKVLKRWWFSFIAIPPFILMRFWVFDNFPSHTAINLTYAITGLMIFLPMLVFLYQTQFERWRTLVLSIFYLTLALLFREIDAREFVSFLPMGTHFLWHGFSGVAGFLLARYLYDVRVSELSLKKMTLSTV